MEFIVASDHSHVQSLSLEDVIGIEKKSLRSIVETICKNPQCRYPLLTLRLLIHIITETDKDGRIYLSPRQLSKLMGTHYDTVTKCLKYLRIVGVLSFDREG